MFKYLIEFYRLQLQINGKEDTSLQDVDRKDLKIAIKVFVSSPDVHSLKEALDRGMSCSNNNNILIIYLYRLLKYIVFYLL